MRSAAVLFIPVFLAGAAGADAASAVNRDTVPHTLTVSEADRRYSITLQPGQSAVFCERGCFVEFPNGELRGLGGLELFEIRPGGAPHFL